LGWWEDRVEDCSRDEYQPAEQESDAPEDYWHWASVRNDHPVDGEDDEQREGQHTLNHQDRDQYVCQLLSHLWTCDAYEVPDIRSQDRQDEEQETDSAHQQRDPLGELLYRSLYPADPSAHFLFIAMLLGLPPVFLVDVIGDPSLGSLCHQSLSGHLSEVS
jgi:hypothetical protein